MSLKFLRNVVKMSTKFHRNVNDDSTKNQRHVYEMSSEFRRNFGRDAVFGQNLCLSDGAPSSLSDRETDGGVRARGPGGCAVRASGVSLRDREPHGARAACRATRRGLVHWRFCRKTASWTPGQSFLVGTH